MTYEFGHATGTQQTTTVSSSQIPYAWFISKGTNTLGQTITYQYMTADRYLYPQTISYGSGNTVNFEYEARTDSIHFVLNGQKGCVGRRLRNITSKTGNSVYRTYTMTYNSTSDASTTKYSRLTYITETGENGNGSRRITLDWNYLPSFSAPSSSVGITLPEGDNLHEYGERYLLAADFNGDGVSDIVHISPVIDHNYNYDEQSRTYVHIYRSSVINGNVSHQSPLFYNFTGGLSVGNWTSQKGGMCVADVDGDGTNDLLLPFRESNGSSVNNYFHFYFALGKNIKAGIDSIKGKVIKLSEAYELPLYAVTDLDNDGKSDLLVLEKQHSNGKYPCHITHIDPQATVQNISLSLTGKPRKLFTGDYNGDGITDMLVICDDGYRVFYGQGGTLSANSFSTSSTLVALSNVHHRIEQGDFNGDGVSDFVWNDHGSNKLYFSLGNGDGTFTRRLAYILPYTVTSLHTDQGLWNCLVTDLDHDGKSDVVVNAAAGLPVFIKTYTHWLLSDGTKLILKKTASSNRKSDAKAGHICVGDFKGQGWLDVMNYGYDCWNGSNADVNPSIHLYGSSARKISDGKVKSVKNSDGRVTSITYGSMTSDKLYTKGTGSTYPLADVAAPLCVVSRMRESGASSVIRQTDYTYKGLRAHLKGRGLLGFTEQRAKESYTGLTTTARITGWNTQYYVPVSMSTTTSQGGFTTTSVSTNIISVHGNNYMRYPSSQTETDIYGNVTTTTFNYNTSKGYLTKRRTESGGSGMYRQTEYTYSTSKIGKAYRPVSVKESQKHSDSTQPYVTTTKYTYNSNGLPTKVVERNGTPMALTTDYVYDSHGNVTKETVSGAGITTPRVTNYQYSGNKFLTQRTTTPASTTITYGRNAFGELTTLVDLTSVGSSTPPLVTSYIRDGFGMVTKETKPSGEVTTYSRTTNSNGSGYTVTVTKAGGGTVTTKYDALDNELSRETKGVGGTVIKTTNTYNSKGLLTTRAKQKGSLTITESMGYDALGRMTRHTSTSGTNVSYSYGNRTTTTTDNGRQYVRTFDAWGNVTESADPISSVSYTYHSNGKPSSASSENATVYMEYDAAGNQIRLEDPDAGICTYEYDALGRVIRQTDARGNETSYTYDAVGRLTARNCEGTVTSYTFGTSGYDKERLVREQTADRTVTYAYNSKGLLASETRSMSGETPVTFTYQYDSKGRLISKGFPKGVTVNYKYNSFGIQSGCDIGGHCTGLVSLDNGGTTTVQYGGTLQMDLDLQVQNPALVHTTTHDSRGYLTGLSLRKNNDPSVLRGMTYNFDGATGNLLSRTGMTAQQETFEYDDLDRLLRVRQGNSVAQQMEYADNGNMESKSWIGDFHYDGQQPHAVTSVDNDLGYIPSTTQQATYTAFGKVESLTDGAYSMSFTYGPDEERWKTVLRQNGTVKRTTFYAGDYERVTENGVTRHFYYLDNGCIYVIEGSQSTGTYYYAFTDHLGSVTHIFNESGGTVFKAEYDAWGRQAVSKNTIGFHRGYTGHEMLPEFGLINMNGRLYDPMLGRFLSPDNYVQMPDFSQSFNRYSYCVNNPLKYQDPDGEWFGIDDLLVSAVSFVVGYVSNGISTGNWGWSSVQSGLNTALSSWIGYNTAGVSNMGNYIAQTSINTVVNTFVPSVSIPIGNHFGFSISPAFGLGSGGLSTGLNIGVFYQNGNFSLGTSLGFSSNYYGWYGELGVENFHIGYGRTRYGATSAYGESIGAQTVGTVKFGVGDVSFALSNDLFGEKHQDRWRTSAAELSIGNFTIGTYVITNDGRYESKYLNEKKLTKDTESPIWGLNKNKKAWKIGNVFAAPFWVGIRNGNQISRIGYNGKVVQALTQNFVHHFIVPTPDYTDYKISTPIYMYYGYNNPISIWNF
ncbi:MAG: VCBS repeat-containing protein [Paludibacteraceae bacterium]|nr:VCBS repeat-containing protein [Paludibacteraceae bacterium]MBQ8714481.1 VCBS repeat-containing protein [Prevotella sp.]